MDRLNIFISAVNVGVFLLLGILLGFILFRNAAPKSELTQVVTYVYPICPENTTLYEAETVNARYCDVIHYTNGSDGETNCRPSNRYFVYYKCLNGTTEGAVLMR